MAKRSAPSTSFVGTLCPTGGEDHGALVSIRGSSKFYCPHQSHDGRPSTAVGGAADQTASFFTDTTPRTETPKEEPEWLS